MGMDAELIDKIQTFVTSELARDGNAYCDWLELIDGDSIGRDPTPLRTWSGVTLCRHSPTVTMEIVNTAKAVAAEAGPGRQRFLLKSHLKDGDRQVLWFAISSPQEEETMGDPYRTVHQPDVKIDRHTVDQVLNFLQRTFLGKEPGIVERHEIVECCQALVMAIERSQETKRSDLENSIANAQNAVASASRAATRAERVTQMAATVAAGIWSRNDPVLDLGDTGSKTIVAKLARETAELILQQETPDVR